MKYKKLTLVFLVILFLLIFTTTGFCSISAFGKEFPDWPDVFEEYNNNYQVAIFYYPNQGRYDLIICQEGMSVNTSSGRFYAGGDLWGHGYSRYQWHPDSENGWVLSSSNLGGNNVSRLVLNGLNYDSSEENYHYLVYSNITIEDVATGDDFFYQTPLTIFSNWQSVIGGSIWQTALKLVAIVMIVIVSYLGLRKALKTLSMLLHRCIILY